MAILLDSAGKRRPWTLIHEIGHFLDHQALGERGRFASWSDEGLATWRDAVDGSRAIELLQEILADGGVTIFEDVLERRIAGSQAFIEQQLLYPEVWARSYVQYIAVRSGDPILLSHLAAQLRTSAGGGDAPYTLQWETDDFLPVLSAIDQVFQGKGWRQ